MKKYFIFIVFSEVINLFLGNKIGFCSDTSIGEPLKCCANYRQVGKTCEECWPGTYGINCTPCPPGFYGRLCIMSCHNLCTSCDPVTGCADSTANETPIDSGKSIRVLLGGFGGIVAILVGLIIWKKCLKTRCPTLHVYDQSDLSNEALEEQFNYDALQIKEEYEEVVTAQEDLGIEFVQQINRGQNMYIDICD